MRKLILVFGVILFCMNSISQEIQHEVTVTLKLVQVYVTDRDGKPIKDLNISDFELYEDGKRKEITEFEKHILLKSRIDKTLVETRPFTSRSLPTRMNRKFFFILDYDRNTMRGVVKAKKSALHFVNTQLQPEDEVGVLSFSKVQGFILHEYLTTDLGRINKAIQKIKDVPGRQSGEGITLDVGSMQAPLSTDASGSLTKGGIPDSLSYFNTSHMKASDIKVGETSIFISGMQEIAKALRYVPGYKHIIFFSEGVSRDMIYAREQTLREKYEALIKEMSGSNCLVYSINTEGTMSYLRESVDRGDHTLQMLSEQTGGKYFEDVQYYEEIADQIQKITSNYYILGYYIDEKWDGKYHAVEVKVKRKDSEVLSQSGYFNPKPYSEYNSLERQLHFIDLAFNKVPFSQAPINFPLTTLVTSDEKDTNLIILSEFQPHKMTPVFNGDTEIATIVSDKDNEVVEYSYGDLNIPSKYKNNVCHYTALPLPHGEYECRIVIRNKKSGSSATAYSKVQIPNERGQQIIFSTPLILIPDIDTSYLQSSLAKKSKSLSLNRIYPFITNKHAPLMNEISKDCRLLHVALRFVTKLKQPKLKLILYIDDPQTEQKTPLAFNIVSTKKEDEVQIYFVEVELPELKPGEYTLGIASQELDTDTKYQMTHAFRVK